MLCGYSQFLDWLILISQLNGFTSFYGKLVPIVKHAPHCLFHKPRVLLLYFILEEQSSQMMTTISFMNYISGFEKLASS